ncbi:MAG TPA: heparinase II/III family protein, partial [Polyangia bacterium]|nr:heparinase II/III family protein [Polyangia bacterium]
MTLRARGWGTIALALVACMLILGRNSSRKLRALRAAAARAEAKTHGPPPIPIEVHAPVARRPRILLDPPTLERLREARKRDSPAWRRVRKACDESIDKPIGGGYQGFDWADIVANLSVCWHATGERRYAERALYYLQALLDDRFKVGDKQGGDDVVTHDTGYPIRTHASFAALAYDWLHDAPGMTPELRARILGRLKVWLRWYDTKGYMRDDPYANYFCGYLAATTFAGLATAGDAPEGERWLAFARDHLLARLQLPALANQMRGGAWPEGWQYGEFSTTEIALIAKAFQTATGVVLARKIPWLGEVVTHHVHQLMPPGHAVYDGGTWGDHPAHPSTTALRAITIALEGVDDARVAEARWLISHAQPNWWGFDETWVALLAERPGAPERDPHAGAPLGLYLSGSGLGFWRSDWGKNAVWLSYQNGPRVTWDHQHNDQGHFELWRGGDGLFIDAGDEEGDATINHNTLLIDDGGKHITYSPNQGVWGQTVVPARVDDDGQVVVVRGDFAAAYTPKCVEDGCVERSVHKALRQLVYVRPALLVLADQVALDEKDIGVTWIA